MVSARAALAVLEPLSEGTVYTVVIGYGGGRGSRLGCWGQQQVVEQLKKRMHSVVDS